MRSFFLKSLIEVQMMLGAKGMLLLNMSMFSNPISVIGSNHPNKEIYNLLSGDNKGIQEFEPRFIR